MAGDLSLSQSLGGLRIANPDEEAVASPSSPTDCSLARPPPPSTHSSGDTITGPRSNNVLPSLSSTGGQQESGLGFNPEAYRLLNTSVSPATSNQARSPHQQSLLRAAPAQRLHHRQSLPLGHQAQQAMQFPSHSPQNYNQQFRNPGMQNTSVRPNSGVYNQRNTSTSSGSSSGAYSYRQEPASPDGGAAGVGRSGSRSSRQVLGQVPTREGSRTYRQGGQINGMGGGNGPLPPRRNSKRARAPTAGANTAQDGVDVPYAVAAPLSRNAEEWRERGASQTTRHETDSNGQTRTQAVKKGVKDFNFGRTLGEGSYSTVLAATDRQNLKEYAIKVLDKRHIIKEKKVKYVNIERDTLNRLTEHPGIVRLYYTFQDERSLYFVLDLASGGELLGVLKKLGSFDLECTRFYAAEILDSVAYMHSRGVIHRDLKPENVLLDRDMHVKITDFGTAKILPDPMANGSNSKVSGNGTTVGDPTDGAETDRAVSFVGTAEYVSPELLRDKNACKASDLWAFGCIIYQLIAGRPPFKAANEYLTFQKILALDYSFPDGFPELARDLVARLLVLEPANRLPVEHIRTHRFFEGVVWGTSLWKLKAPRLKAYMPPAAQPIKLNGSANGNGVYTTPGNLPTPMMASHASPPQPNTPRPQLRGVTELPPPSQLDIDWSPVLTHNNERILKLGNLIVVTSPQPHSPNGKGGDETGGSAPSEKPKFSRFWGGGKDSKKRERLVLITSSARILIAAAGGNEKKAKMDVKLLAGGCSWKGFVDGRGLTAWSVDTRDKHITFEDPRATTSDPDGSKFSTQEWLSALDSARELALSTQNFVSTSYSGDDSLLNSALSSPTDSLGDAAMPLSGPVTGGGHHLRQTLRKREGDEDGEGKGKGAGGGMGMGRKRFSKRHSRSGLAAVF